MLNLTSLLHKKVKKNNKRKLIYKITQKHLQEYLFQANIIQTNNVLAAVHLF